MAVIDTIAQAIGFPFAVLLVLACIAIVIAVVTDAFIDRQDSGRPIGKLPPLKLNPTPKRPEQKS